MLSKPTTVAFKFSVDKQYCVAKVHFSATDDPEEVVAAFVEAESIPIYLQNPILWSICTLFRTLGDVAAEQAEAVLSGNGSVLGARLLANQYRREYIKWRKTELFTDKFTSSYQYLLQSKDTRDTLEKLERSYSVGMRKLSESREHTIENLRSRQLEEMEKQSKAKMSTGGRGGSNDGLGVLVQRHIEEMDTLERKWEIEIEEAHASQREEFHNFVITFTEDQKQTEEETKARLELSPNKTRPFQKERKDNDGESHSDLEEENSDNTNSKNNKNTVADNDNRIRKRTPLDSSNKTPPTVVVQMPPKQQQPKQLSESAKPSTAQDVTDILSPHLSRWAEALEDFMKPDLPTSGQSSPRGKRTRPSSPLPSRSSKSDDDSNTESKRDDHHPNELHPDNNDNNTNHNDINEHNEEDSDSLKKKKRKGKTNNKNASNNKNSFALYLGVQRKFKFTINILTTDLLDFLYPYSNSHRSNATDNGNHNNDNDNNESNLKTDSNDRRSNDGNKGDDNRKHTDDDEPNTNDEDAAILEAHTLYSSSLSAVLMISDLLLSLQSKQYIQLLQLSRLSPEFHFASLKEQLETVNKKMIQREEEERAELGGGETKGWESGDFVVTKHSNFRNAHVLFHLMAKKGDNSNDFFNSLLGGLRNILSLASKYGVKTLTLPILLVEAESRHLFTEDQLLRHAENVLRAIKSFFIETTKSKRVNLATINLLLPNVTGELSEKVKKLVQDLSFWS